MFKAVLVACAALSLAACATTLSTHPVEPSALGTPVSTSAMLAALKTPGTVTVEKIVSADWVFRYGSAKADETPPNWEAGTLNAQVFFYKLRHPTHGLVLIDAGMPADAKSLIDPLTRAALSIGDTMHVRTSTADALHGEAPRAVLLTHLHYDHVLGVRDTPRQTPLYAGPGDGAQRHVLNMFVAPTVRRALEGRAPLREWRFLPDPDNRLAGVIDVFGDGSVFAIHVPGHTPGSTAYIVNAVDGVHLMTGDTDHSRAAWLGERIDLSAFEADLDTLWRSLAQLKSVAAGIPGIRVHPGHQDLAGRL